MDEEKTLDKGFIDYVCSMETNAGKNLHREVGPLSDEPESVGDTVRREKTACWSEIGAL